MRRYLTGLALITLAVAVPLRGQEVFVSFPDLVRRVAERDPGVRARATEQEAARSEARRTETLRLPKFTINTDMGVGKVVDDVANVLLTGLTPVAVTDTLTRSRLGDLSSNRHFFVPGAHLEDNFFDGGRTGALIRSAWLNQDKAEVARDRSKDDEAYEAASDFLNLAQGQVLGRYLDEYAQVADLAATALADQAREGRITEARALAGQAKLQAARAALENNRDDLRLLSESLRRRAGLPPDAAFETRALEARLAESSAAPVPEDGALEKNPDLRNALLDAQLQEQQVRSARAQRVPEFHFVADYGFFFSSTVFTYRPGYSVGVHATFPLFTSGEVARNIKTQQERLEASRLKQEKVRAELDEDCARLLVEHRKLARQLQAARSQLTQAEEVYRVARLKFDQGAGSPSDLLEAADLLLNSRQRCLDLTRSSLLLRWTAFRLQGTLLAQLERGVLP